MKGEHESGDGAYRLERLRASGLVRRLRLRHAVAHADELAIDVLEASGESILDGLRDLEVRRRMLV